MPTLEQLCHEMKTLHCATQSWQKVGNKYGINKALARLIANGYQPGAKIRAVLGLPEHRQVIAVAGEIVHPDALTIGSKLCIDCGRAFIPNHPRRKRCFICSPFRKRKNA